MPSPARVDRWQHLVTLAFRLDASPPEAAAAEARSLLDSALAVFPEGIDPVDDFEGYAVRRLALALAKALESKASEDNSLR